MKRIAIHTADWSVDHIGGVLHFIKSVNFMSEWRRVRFRRGWGGHGQHR